MVGGGRVRYAAMSEPRRDPVERLEEALDSSDAGAAYALAVELRDAGLTQAELLAVFDAVRARHHDDPDERKYDAVLDVMDLIAGWCSRDNALYPEPPPAT
jgi:hypothetical protein